MMLLACAAQVLLSNVGGTATMVGDPPNVIIGTALQKYVGFVDFIIHLAPGACNKPETLHPETKNLNPKT